MCPHGWFSQARSHMYHIVNTVCMYAAKKFHKNICSVLIEAYQLWVGQYTMTSNELSMSTMLVSYTVVYWEISVLESSWFLQIYKHFIVNNYYCC